MLDQIFAPMYNHRTAEWTKEAQIRMHSLGAVERALIVQSGVWRAIVHVCGEDGCCSPELWGQLRLQQRGAKHASDSVHHFLSHAVYALFVRVGVSDGDAGVFC